MAVVPVGALLWPPLGLQVLMVNLGLTDLNLSWNKLRARGIGHLAEGLKPNLTLQVGGGGGGGGRMMTLSGLCVCAGGGVGWSGGGLRGRAGAVGGAVLHCTVRVQKGARAGKRKDWGVGGQAAGRTRAMTALRAMFGGRAVCPP